MITDTVGVDEVASAWRGLSGKKTPKMETGFLWSMGMQAAPGKEASDHQSLSGGVLGGSSVSFSAWFSAGLLSELLWACFAFGCCSLVLFILVLFCIIPEVLRIPGWSVT